MAENGPGAAFDVRAFGATGNGKTIDTPAVNRAIEAAAAAGGGTVRFAAGTYACYSIHLKSFVVLHLDPGATILAASTPREGTTSGYDPAESNAPWEAFHDFGHIHWHNSLIWGENIHDFAILGQGRIWGRGLARGHDDPLWPDLPYEVSPGAGNKAIALKNCHNVVLRDFSILAAGHFGIRAAGVDNLTIDNLKIDTVRDGMNIDCCKNVRISNCSVNSPWDDGICLKSSFALGTARATENVTIANCYVSGDWQLGTMLDGTFKRSGPEFDPLQCTGRIKFGTESNGGFKNITIANCVFESCRGLALETVDGATLEDISIVGISMRDIRNAPLFLRLGARMNGPTGIPVGTLRRVIISNLTCYGPANAMPSIISGIPGHCVEDIKISDVYILQKGGGSAETAAVRPPEGVRDYPEPMFFGPLPALGFFIRHARNVEFSNLEIAAAEADARPSFWLDDVDRIDFFGLKSSRGLEAPVFALNNVRQFRVSGSRDVKDTYAQEISTRDI